MHEIKLTTIEDKNGCLLWEFTGWHRLPTQPEKDEFYGQDPDALEAIIKSGWSSTRNGASQVAKELGHDFPA